MRTKNSDMYCTAVCRHKPLLLSMWPDVLFFCRDYGLLLELHTLTLAARSWRTVLVRSFISKPAPLKGRVGIHCWASVKSSIHLPWMHAIEIEVTNLESEKLLAYKLWPVNAWSTQLKHRQMVSSARNRFFSFAGSAEQPLEDNYYIVSRQPWAGMHAPTLHGWWDWLITRMSFPHNRTVLTI